MFMSEKLMLLRLLLLRYYRFQITKVTFVMHYPFRNDSLIICASERSERTLRTMMIVYFHFSGTAIQCICITYLPHGNINESLTDKLLTKDQYREKIYVSASELGKFSHLKVPKLLCLSMFELVLTNNMTCFSVTLLLHLCIHSMQFPFYILLMT